MADPPALAPLQQAMAADGQAVFESTGALWCVAPVSLVEGETPWTLAIRVPLGQVNAASTALVWKQGGLTILTVAIAIVLAWTLARSVVKPIRAVAAVMTDIAQGDGDLTRRLSTDGLVELADLSRAFNAFAGKVHDIMVQVDSVTRNVTSASSEISASTEEVAAGMSEQSGQVEQITSAIEQMTVSVADVARKSVDATRCAEVSGAAAERGGDIVRKTVCGISAIRDAVISTAASVTELGKRGEQIGQIIAVINDIADQTNLLALNAAIEAARAGEHGRGFAVVADEVRKLADRTTMATREVASSIEAIQHETAQAVERMETGTTQVARGVASATQAGESLQQIVGGAKDVASMIQSIAAAAEEQSLAGTEVRRHVDAVSAVTKQTAEGAADAARAVADLSSQAADLQRLVDRFKLDRPAATAGQWTTASSAAA